MTISAKLFALPNLFFQTVFLNRDQTNEWRGWMQLVILLYHYIGASKVMIVIGSDSVDGFTHYFF